MAFDDSQSSSTFFHRAARFSDMAASCGTAIYEFHFNHLAFGSWVIVAGRRNRMIRFSYDGKDSLLTFGDSSIEVSAYADLRHRRIKTWEGEDPMEYIGQVLSEEFAEPSV